MFLVWGSLSVLCSLILCSKFCLSLPCKVFYLASFAITFAWVRPPLCFRLNEHFTGVILTVLSGSAEFPLMLLWCSADFLWRRLCLWILPLVYGHLNVLFESSLFCTCSGFAASSDGVSAASCFCVLFFFLWGRFASWAFQNGFVLVWWLWAFQTA